MWKFIQVEQKPPRNYHMSNSEAPEVEYVSCNLCGRDTTMPFRQIDTWQIVRCTHCGLKYLNPRPTVSQLTNLYSTKYFDVHYTQDNVEEQVQRHSDLVIQYEQLLKKKGGLLDVGCGYGFLVAAAQRRGWYAKGIDISESAVTFGREQLDANLEQAVPETWTPDRLYSVVVSSHSLEHVADPSGTLSKLQSFMHPTEAVLHIRVPNVNSLDRRWHGNAWWAWDPPFHFYFFEPSTLMQLLKQAGFKEIRIRNGIFDPFSHLLADLQTGKLRNDGPAYLHRAYSQRQGAGQQFLYLASCAYRKTAYHLHLSKLLPDRDFEVWARI